MKARCSLPLLIAALVSLATIEARAVDLVTLAPQTWDRYIPHGKEVDGIYGDFALTNDKLVAVIGQPLRTRNANMTVREVGGCLIDLTLRHHQSDQLSAYYPGAGLRELRFGGIEVQAPKTYETSALDRVFVQGRSVSLKFIATPREKEADIEVTYTLEDGKPYITISTTYVNRGESTIDVAIVDSIRADNSFEFETAASAPLFWAYDKHFGQAYGVSAEGQTISPKNTRGMLLQFADSAGKVALTLKPGEQHKLVRQIFPGANLFDLRAVHDGITGKPAHRVVATVKDPAGNPVFDAEVSLTRGKKKESWGRTNAKGQLAFNSGEQAETLTVASQAHGTKEVAVAANQEGDLAVELPAAAVLSLVISDEQGGRIPCKVQFIGKGDTKSPDFGHDSGEHGVRNVHYSHDGRFHRTLAPGAYDLIVSYGPEYDAVFKTVELQAGKTSTFEAKLVRSVKSPGWISTDYHSHSSPSGDNTASQLGRVLNLLCEHVEFAPCTEHNRLSTYDPHLKALGAVKLMATCVGMEMTGQPLPLNHQNAFPMVLNDRTQDNGAPIADQDPETQITRLAAWDNNSDKLVQSNHPDIGWMFRDRNGDGTPDAGFAGLVGKIDVIEVHPLQTIFDKPNTPPSRFAQNNTVVNWLQMLNQGKRIPGVVNTDAHYNFHGSGFLRNYVKSPTDDPALIKTLDVVHASERGNLVMTSGPFMEVSLRPEAEPSKEVDPGDDLSLKDGKAKLNVRVQCPNWFDIDRVQVLINGSPSKEHNFTREANSSLFASGTVKFDQEIAIDLKSDAHIIVVAIGEKSELGTVLGPEHKSDKPVAVSNPIYVDTNGDGFQPNKDTLGILPVKGGS